MLEWLTGQGKIIAYLFLLICALLESLVPPFPSDIFVLLLAFLAGQGKFDVILVYLSAVAGSICGIMVLYTVGIAHGEAVLKFLSRGALARLVPVDMIARARAKFMQRGNWLLLLNRFLPGARAVIGFTAGLVRLKSGRVFYLSLASVAAWNLFLIIAGFYVGKTWSQASSFLRNYSIGAIVIIVFILMAITAVYFRRKK
jgi:membrane protein DedA with SNARE-associated domain